MISGHAAATAPASSSLRGGEGVRPMGTLDNVGDLECRHARSLAGGLDTAISQATTVPFGGGAGPDSQDTVAHPEPAEAIEVDDTGDDKDGVATAKDLSTAAPTPEAGISEDLDELRPWIEPPVPKDPNRIPARKLDSMEEFIPVPGPVEPMGHHTSALERLLVKRSDKDSSGSETSRKPPPPLKFPDLNPLALDKRDVLRSENPRRWNSLTWTLVVEGPQIRKTSSEVHKLYQCPMPLPAGARDRLPMIRTRLPGWGPWRAVYLHTSNP